MRISLAKFHCDIVLAKPDLSGLSDFFDKNSGNYTSCALISNDFVYSKYGEFVKNLIESKDIRVHPIILPVGETTKTLDSAAVCWEQMHREGLDRKSVVVGLGGGVTTDLAGFVASCYMRGIDAVHIPTTLLAMVDAAIGGKTGVNLQKGKNLIGTYHHPRLVLIAPHWLKDLPERIAVRTS